MSPVFVLFIKNLKCPVSQVSTALLQSKMAVLPPVVILTRGAPTHPCPTFI